MSYTVSFEILYGILHEVPWPSYIALYIYFTGMSAGSFVLSSLGNVFGITKFKPLSRIGVIIAIILLMLAPMFLLLDLSQPAKFYTTLYFTNPNSVMSWGVYLLTLYPLACTIYAWFLFRADFVRLVKKNAGSFIKRSFYFALSLGQTDLTKKTLARDKKWGKIIGSLCVPLAIMVHGYTGFILAAVESRDLWHTSLMPLLFLISAIVSGIALFIIVMVIYQRYFSRSGKIDRPMLNDLAKMMAWMIVFDLCLFLSEIIVLQNSGAGGRDALWLLTQGPLQVLFIVVELILGAIVPMALMFHPKTGKHLGTQLFASALVLVGILAMRFNVIVGGQFVPMVGGEIVQYTPHLVEVLDIIMVTFLGALMTFIAFKILPIETEKPEKKVTVKAETKVMKKTPLVRKKPVPLVAAPFDRRRFIKMCGLIGAALIGTQIGLIRLDEMVPGSGSGTVSASRSGSNKTRYAMVIDSSKCIGCHSCTQACKETYDLPENVWRSWVSKIKKTNGEIERPMFLPRLCNHCDNPPCVRVCPVQATYKDKHGIIRQRYDRCIGCRYCMAACPYGARTMNPDLGVVDKCSFCHHRVEAGLEPSCVVACPVGARTFGNINDSSSEVSKVVSTKATTVLKPELGTKPMVFYIGADKDLLEAGIHEKE